jgi:predicted DCC family thiol-disulfide oxidoreductase YuxK
VGAILDSRLVLPVAQIVYSWVARNRSRFPQACGVNASPDAHKEY